MEPKKHIFLMFCGISPDGKEYRKWSVPELKPLVVFRDGPRKDSFFPAFLLLGIKSGHGKTLIPGFGAPGTKEDWLAWLDDLFLPQHNLEALAGAVAEAGVQPVDIWVSLPYPEPAQRKFGYLSDRKISFAGNQDRATAVKWWINRFLARWYGRIKSKGLERYLSLQGFYWGRESMTPNDRFLLPGLISHIHSLGFRTLWIPYFAVTPFLNITNPGFDITIIQPSYLQDPQLTWRRLTSAAERAGKYRAGIEIEFDTGVLYSGSLMNKVALDYLNRGLPEYEGYMTSGYVAYYTGYKTVPELFRQKNPLYNHLYHFVKGKLQKIEYPGIEY